MAEVTLDKPDKEKRSHGVLWYVAGTLMIYVLSFPPVMILVCWLVAGNLMPRVLLRMVGMFYVPVAMLIELLGLEDAVVGFVQWALRQLPPP